MLRAVALILFALGCGAIAQAGTTHHIRFVQDARILVWQDDLLTDEGASLVLRPPGAQSLGSFLGSGQLAQDIVSTSEMTVKVASNTGFLIRASETVSVEGMVVQIGSMGDNAVASTTAPQSGSGVIFHQVSKTAQRPGQPLSQAIELTIRWPGHRAPALEIIAVPPGT